MFIWRTENVEQHVLTFPVFLRETYEWRKNVGAMEMAEEVVYKLLNDVLIDNCSLVATNISHVVWAKQDVLLQLGVSYIYLHQQEKCKHRQVCG